MLPEPKTADTVPEPCDFSSHSKLPQQAAGGLYKSGDTHSVKQWQQFAEGFGNSLPGGLVHQQGGSDVIRFSFVVSLVSTIRAQNRTSLLAV